MTGANMLPRIIHIQLAIDVRRFHGIVQCVCVCACVCVCVCVCERERESGRGKAHRCRKVHRYIITPDRERHI